MGRKCESCFERVDGYCPFDYACKFEVWDLYPLSKRAKRFFNDVQNNRREAFNQTIKHFQYEGVSFGEDKKRVC